MTKFSRDAVADVLAATDIVEVIGAAVELKPAGAGRFKGLCPFHHEKTPSFSVNRDRQMFYCFGCQKGGDAIGFLCAHEGLTFVEALRKLADKAGVRLPAATESESKEDFQRARLVEFGKFAAGFYTENLNNPLKGGPGRQYLKTRQLKPETVKRFGLGYALDDWQTLVDAARTAGFKDVVLESSGLAKRGDRGGLYDFFRNRLIFPIRDVSGNYVAFGGRDLAGGPAKYINSPENPIYHKGKVLYGLYEARDAIRREKRAIMVEGYFDLLRCFDLDIEHVVAPCGTALTLDQATLLRRYAHEVILVFDGDAAGIRAALRGVGILTEAGLSVRAQILPGGLDPDDYGREHGGPALRTILDEAMDFVTFYVRANAVRLDTIEGRTEVAQDIFGVLTRIQDGLRRDEYLKRAARELHVDFWLCREEFAKFSRRQGLTAPRAAAKPVKPEAPAFRPDECRLIAMLLRNGAWIELVKKELAGVELEPGPLAEVLSVLFETSGPEAVHRLDTDDGRALYAAAANQERPRDDATPETVAHNAIELRITALRAEKQRIEQGLRAGGLNQDPARMMEMRSRLVIVNRAIDETVRRSIDGAAPARAAGTNLR